MWFTRESWFFSSEPDNTVTKHSLCSSSIKSFCIYKNIIPPTETRKKNKCGNISKIAYIPRNVSITSRHESLAIIFIISALFGSLACALIWHHLFSSKVEGKRRISFQVSAHFKNSSSHLFWGLLISMQTCFNWPLIFVLWGKIYMQWNTCILHVEYDKFAQMHVPVWQPSQWNHGACPSLWGSSFRVHSRRPLAPADDHSSDFYQRRCVLPPCPESGPHKLPVQPMERAARCWACSFAKASRYRASLPSVRPLSQRSAPSRPQNYSHTLFVALFNNNRLYMTKYYLSLPRCKLMRSQMESDS